MRRRAGFDADITALDAKAKAWRYSSESFKFHTEASTMDKIARILHFEKMHFWASPRARKS